MAKAVVTLAGYGIGSALGQPQLGAIIGGVVAGILFPPPPTYGPRLEDTKTAPGTYGSPIGIAYGLSDFQADLIWVKGNELDEKKNKQSASAKGGDILGGPQTVTFEYYATFAALICDDEIDAVRRVYLGKELVYDGTSDALDAWNPLDGTDMPLTGAVDWMTMRIYTGAADQAPDPSIQAEDANASAMRGMAYLVFEDLPLEKFGNQIPPVFVEVAASAAASKIYRALSEYDLVPSDQLPAGSLDPVRGRIYVGGRGDNATYDNPAQVEVYDALTGQHVRTDSFQGSANVWYEGTVSGEPDTVAQPGPPTLDYNSHPPAVAPDGSFYVVHEMWADVPNILGGTGLVIDAETGQHVATLGTTDNVAYNVLGATDAFGFWRGHSSPESLYHIVREVDYLTIDETTGLQPFLYLRCNAAGTIFYGPVSVASRGAVNVTGLVTAADVNSVNSYIYMDINKAGDAIYAVYNNSSSASVIERIPISGTVQPDTVQLTTGIGTLAGCVWNRDANTFCVWGTGGIGVYDADLTHIKTRTDVNQVSGNAGIIGDQDGVVWFATARGQNLDLIRGYSTETGEIVTTLDLTDWGLAEENYLDPVWKWRSDIYVAHSPTITGSSTANRPVLIFGDRWAGDKIPLSGVLADLAYRAGLDAGQLDLASVTRQIYGAPQKSNSVTARGVWEDLLLHTDHAAWIDNGALKVARRASSVTGSLDDDDLGADGKPALTRRTDPSGVIQSVELTYKSQPANLEEAHQQNFFPLEVVQDGARMKLSTSIIMDDDEAWEDVQRLLAIGSSERTEMRISVAYGAGVGLNEIWSVAADGGTHDMRIEEISGSRRIDVRGTPAWPFLTPSGTPIDSTRDPPTLAEISAPEFALIDSHVWRDDDNDGAFYLAGWPRTAGLQWNGEVIFRSTDPKNLVEAVAAVVTAATVGAAREALGDVVDAAFWDRANTITVDMLSGTPESATEAAVLTGSNPVWIQCGGTGEWELIQFATATENADGTWTLSTLLRGRRGTEHLTGSHTIGDRLIWASVNTGTRIGGTQIGTQLYYAAASIGASQDDTTRRGFTNNARSLRPYSVVQVTGARDGSDNLTISWVARSRVTGIIWRSDRPLGEDTEAYEVDVMNGSTVVRTIEVTDTTASYTAAQQTTDFGSTQNPVIVRVYQLSATYGRGVVREATI